MRWMILLVALLLGGCYAANGKRGGEGLPALYDFGTPVAVLPAAPRKVTWGLEVKVPAWFDTQGIDYRLAYVDGARLREYAQARWAGQPSQLLQQRLSQRLLLALPSQGRQACLLRIDVSEFSQVFRSPERSAGLLQGRAVLFDASRRRLAELDLNFEQAAATPDARGGVGALTLAVDALGEALLAWEQRLIAEGRASACAGS